MTIQPDMPGPDYLGDGVYVRFDGYQFWVSTNPTGGGIALEPEVLEALNRYAGRIAAWAGEVRARYAADVQSRLATDAEVERANRAGLRPGETTVADDIIASGRKASEN